MLINFRVTAMITAAVVLAGCASSTTKPIASAAAVNNPNCLTSTGSRIPVTGTDCTATGRSYSNQDLQRTGATSVAGALPLMDPSLTVVQH
jgi:hypothetical protein